MNVDKKTGAYEAPGIECLDIKAEAGFAMSTGGSTNSLGYDDSQNDPNSFDNN